jgi:methylated-DNA-[protein]-cysteine S-methyltransferase
MGGVIALEWASFGTPVGPVSVGCGSGGVARVRFGIPPPPPPSPSPPPPPPAGDGQGPPSAADERRALAQTARRQLAEYFRGQRQHFELPLDWSGFAPPQHRVLGLLHDRVEYGRTVTYGALASLAGLPASRDVVPARTVGKIMGANPIPVIVPCHRVVASDGLGGYSGGAGPEVKRWLLILEGALPPTLDWVPASPADT